MARHCSPMPPGSGIVRQTEILMRLPVNPASTRRVLMVDGTGGQVMTGALLYAGSGEIPWRVQGRPGVRPGRIPEWRC